MRGQLDEAHLAAGDVVVLSSPGGDLEQALIMGEIIRSRGLATAVGTLEASGKLTRAYCASACVLVYAGGSPRYGVEGSALGVHRFVNRSPGRDPVADAQRTTGAVLSYMTKMGVSSSIIEAMSATRDVRWLDPRRGSENAPDHGSDSKRAGCSLIVIFHHIPGYRAYSGKKSICGGFFNPSDDQFRLCRDAAWWSGFDVRTTGPALPMKPGHERFRPASRSIPKQRACSSTSRSPTFQ